MLIKKLLILYLLLMITLHCAGDDSHIIRLHVLRMADINALVYRISDRIRVRSLVSRHGVNFHSQINHEKKQKTFAIDHCYNPGEQRGSDELVIKLRSSIKTPCRRCRNIFEAWTLKDVTSSLMSSPDYFRIAQHSDEKKMITDKGSYNIHSELKYGDPINKKKRNELVHISESDSTKTLISRMSRWVIRARQPDYLKKKSTMKSIGSDAYPDFMLGIYCRIGIVEVVAYRDGKPAPAIILYSHMMDHALMIEVDQITGLPAVISPMGMASVVALMSSCGVMSDVD